MDYPLIPEAERDEGASYRYYSFVRPRGFTHMPGQYIVMHLGDAKHYLAIASHPDENHLGFLIGRGSAPDLFLRDKTPDAGVRISAAQGPGLTADRLSAKRLFLITHGTGISAIRPVLEDLLKAPGNYGDTVLMYGSRSPDTVPFSSDFNRWKRALKTEIHLSEADQAAESGFFPGRLTLRLPQLQISPDDKAVVIGSREMSAETGTILSQLGLPAERILSNF